MMRGFPMPRIDNAAGACGSPTGERTFAAKTDPAPASRSRTPALPLHHLNQMELARRWRISHRTLERWRWLGQGPTYLKLGGRVAYQLADIEAVEAARAVANPANGAAADFPRDRPATHCPLEADSVVPTA
jgi:hypothetical protein